MLGAEQIDRAARPGVRRHELVRQRLDPAVNRVRDGDREPRRRTRRERETERLGRDVDLDRRRPRLTLALRDRLCPTIVDTMLAT